MGKQEKVLQKKGAEYEAQRATRIAHNKERMESLGLQKMANSLMGSKGKEKQKEKIVLEKDKDIDYEPESDDDDDEVDQEIQKEKELESTMDRRNDETLDRNVGNQENIPSQSKKRKGRGPSRAVQSSVPMILDFDEFDLPIGRWESLYGRQIGQCALRIDITAQEFSKVDPVKLDIFWAETKKMFHIEDPEGKRKKNFMVALKARFRRHKSWLVSRFIKKKKVDDEEGNATDDKKPWEVYGCYITKEQWETFETYVTSEEFQKKSEIGQKSSKGNIHRHTLGQMSYSRARPKWVKENRLPPPTESTTTESTSSVLSDRFQQRAREWCLAHQKRTKDGKWEVDPNKVETARVVTKVMEHLEKEAKEIEDGVVISSEPGKDALSKALGKPDNYGYVKGISRLGVGVGHRKVFGKLPRKGIIISNRDHEIEELKETIKRMESRFETTLQQKVAEEVKSYIASLSSLNIPPILEIKCAPTQQQPILHSMIIKEPKICRLAMEDDDGNLFVVADGTVHPCDDGVVHSSKLLPDHYKVSIDNPYEEHKLVKLPVPSPDGETELGKSKGYFVQWPISMVVFDEMDNALKTLSQSKEQVGSCDPYRSQESGAGLDNQLALFDVGDLDMDTS